MAWTQSESTAMLLLRVDRGRWRGRPGHRLRVTVQVTDSNVICECPLVTVTAARPVARRGSCDGKLRVSGPAARATAAQVSLLCRSGRRRAAGPFYCGSQTCPMHRHPLRPADPCLHRASAKHSGWRRWRLGARPARLTWRPPGRARPGRFTGPPGTAEAPSLNVTFRAVALLPV